jgi:ribosomal protein S18 acetylase RimI-like enzyme
MDSVSASLREVLGDPIFFRLKPDWEAAQAEDEGMGVIDIIGVDPDFQRRGIASQLTEHAPNHMRRCGMDIAAGGDPGHAPARAAYEALGITLLPSARYLKLLND